LDDLDLSLGKRTRLHRLLYEHGPGNGTLLLLPIDQGLEHGPVDFFPNPESADPDYQCRLALEGGYSGIVFHVGLAQKYMRDYAGKVPLVLKLNGKTKRLGADAVGYTLYVGSPAQGEDFVQLQQIREACDYYGMPLIIWSYPRGEAIEKKGGRDSVYAVDYAARVADELGADVVKLNVPKFEDSKNAESPKPYNTLYKDMDYASAVAKVVASAGKTMVLFSGGSKISDEDLLEKARICMEQGATGLIFGRNMWQRPFEEGLTMTAKIKEMMRSV